MENAVVFICRDDKRHIFVGPVCRISGDFNFRRYDIRGCDIQDKIAAGSAQSEFKIIQNNCLIDSKGAVISAVSADRDASCKVCCALSKFVSSVCLICRNGDGISRSSRNQRKIVDKIIVAFFSVRKGKINDCSGICRNGCIGSNLQTAAMHAAGGDAHRASGIDRGAVRHAAGGDVHVASGNDSGIVRHAAGGDVHSAPVIDGGVIRRSAGVDEHPASVIDSGAVRHAAGGDAHVAATDRGAVRHAAVGDPHVAYGIDSG